MSARENTGGPHREREADANDSSRLASFLPLSGRHYATYMAGS
ncbi:UNVERIFIED_ORG: hypothetical protein BCL66_1156 [Martelella mediterranea]